MVHLKRRIRYGVVGLGHIAQVAVLPAFAHAGKNVQLPSKVVADHQDAAESSSGNIPR